MVGHTIGFAQRFYSCRFHSCESRRHGVRPRLPRALAYHGHQSNKSQPSSGAALSSFLFATLESLGSAAHAFGSALHPISPRTRASPSPRSPHMLIIFQGHAPLCAPPGRLRAWGGVEGRGPSDRRRAPPMASSEPHRSPAHLEPPGFGGLLLLPIAGCLRYWEERRAQHGAPSTARPPPRAAAGGRG